MWPVLTINPIRDALRAIAWYRRTHGGQKPRVLRCGPDAYAQLVSVLPQVTSRDDDGGWTITDAKVVEDEYTSGFFASGEQA